MRTVVEGPAPGVRVWLCNPSSPEIDGGCPAYEALLSADELRRCRGFRFESDRRLYLVSHALLRTVLAREIGIEPRVLNFSYDARGRPELHPKHGSVLRFSLSHTRGCAALAVTERCDVGVDVETLARNDFEMAVARRFFGTIELKALEAIADAELRTQRFFLLWTLKEAFLKATGRGLSAPVDVQFDLNAEPPLWLPAPGDASTVWRFVAFRHPPHVGAVALGGARTPREFSFVDAIPLGWEREVKPTLTLRLPPP